MSEKPVVEVLPHDGVLLMVVCQRTLDEPSAHKLLDEVISESIQRPRVPIVLDISKVKFAPSVALGCLVQLNRDFKVDHRRMALIGVDPRLMGTIQVTRLDAILEIHGTLEQAVAALK